MFSPDWFTAFSRAKVMYIFYHRNKCYISVFTVHCYSLICVLYYGCRRLVFVWGGKKLKRLLWIVMKLSGNVDNGPWKIPFWWFSSFQGPLTFDQEVYCPCVWRVFTLGEASVKKIYIYINLPEIFKVHIRFPLYCMNVWIWILFHQKCIFPSWRIFEIDLSHFLHSWGKI